MAAQSTSECVSLLLENDTETFLKAAQTLSRILENVFKNPTVEKYRRIKLSSKVVEESLLPCSGAMEFLFEAGFVEDNQDSEYLHIPMGADLTSVKSLCAEITASVEQRKGEQQQLVKSSGDATRQSPVANKAASNDKPAAKWPKWKFPTLPNHIQVSEMTFHQKLKSAFDHVLMYEDLQLQEKARSCVPIERLKQMATEKFSSAKVENNLKAACVDREITENTEKGQAKFDLADFYIIELMDWYREDFFRWVNAPDCERCSAKTQQNGMGQPNSDDMRWGAGRVELYRCTSCGHITRFPRYNHPGKLLETRRGRCGEWANCFTLICRASGYEARHVLDWTDHVWTEVFSHSQQRWLHCDPGEKALDRPLLYEAGWGKKLTYIIACSKDDINDVTWRYSADHQALILRRTQCREDWLVKTIGTLRDERQKGMSDIVKRVHRLRLLKEGGEFLFGQSKKISAGEMIGRQTGSLEWRESRGEMGDNSKLSTHHTFIPNSSNIEEGSMIVSYCAGTNMYSQSGETKEKYDWKTCIYESTDVQRNVEIDWNMVYLARNKTSSTACVLWRFDLTSAGKSLESLSLFVSSETFHSGSIKWSVENQSGQSVSIQSGQECSVQSLKGSSIITLKAELSGGDGENAWQHTQLFRQKRDSAAPMLKLVLKF